MDPVDRIARYSSDGLRYYLMKDGVPHSDGSQCLLPLLCCSVNCYSPDVAVVILKFYTLMYSTMFGVAQLLLPCRTRTR